MSDTSPILALPLIQPAQAQKHVTHNEALRLLDVLVQAAVATRGANTAPPAPTDGERHIVGTAPVGTWAGQADRIAVWEEASGWFFLAPQEGWTAHVRNEGNAVTYVDGQWAAASDRTLRVARLGIGTDADATNRLSVVSPTTLLSHAGSGHRLVVNKAIATDTASLLFQTGFSGRAELGTVGADDFTIRVSPDGAAFSDGLRLAATTGEATLPAGLQLPAGSPSAPALRFEGDPDTGLLHPGADQVALATGGSQRWLVTGTACESTVPLHVPAGSAATPSVCFSDDTDLGVYRASSDALAVAAGGTERLRVTTTGLQVTGTITGTAVTQSTTDATANRLLRVADFGLGGRAPAMPTADFAALPQSGLYRGTANQTTNVPSSEAAVSRFFNMLAVRGSNANEMRNFLFMYPYTDGKLADLFIGGTDSAGTSVAWQRVFTQGSVLGAVSQSAGVPTGRLIEHGWNANGFFTRLASGLQVCRRTITASSAAAATWTYPAAYADAPEVTGCVVSTVLSAVCLDSTPGTTGCTFSARDKTDARRADTCQLIAVGRWFI